MAHIPRENPAIICTGSQGEPLAALAKLSRDEMKSVALTAGDTVVFSSRTIPGNERAILEIKNRLIDLGMKIIEDGDSWCMSRAIRAAVSCARCMNGCGRRSAFPCMARRRIWWRRAR
ncbi:hypothetical protein ACVOMV_11600 [Mesorhizobium atlanticum]